MTDEKCSEIGVILAKRNAVKGHARRFRVRDHILNQRLLRRGGAKLMRISAERKDDEHHLPEPCPFIRGVEMNIWSLGVL